MYFRFSRQTWVTFLQCHQQRLVSSISGGKTNHTLWKYTLEIQIGNTKWKYKLEIQIGNTNWKYKVERQIGIKKLEIQIVNTNWKYKMGIQSGNQQWKGGKSDHANYSERPDAMTHIHTSQYHV